MFLPQQIHAEGAAEIERYCVQNAMAPNDKYRIRLVIEELIQRILLPHMPEPRIHVTIEYAAQETRTDLTLTYSGGRFDPRETDNELSLYVLSSAGEEFSYSYDPQSEEPNCVELRIK